MDGDYLKLLKFARKIVDKDYLVEIDQVQSEYEKKLLIGNLLLKYLTDEIDFLEKKLFILEHYGKNVFDLKIQTSILGNKLHFFKSTFSASDFLKINSSLNSLKQEILNGAA